MLCRRDHNLRASRDFPDAKLDDSQCRSTRCSSNKIPFELSATAVECWSCPGISGTEFSGIGFDGTDGKLTKAGSVFVANVPEEVVRP